MCLERAIFLNFYPHDRTFCSFRDFSTISLSAKKKAPIRAALPYGVSSLSCLKLDGNLPYLGAGLKNADTDSPFYCFPLPLLMRFWFSFVFPFPILYRK
ncbi:hypothetical protein D7X87_23810 [bacterium D16-54]|nr:hypothetical protein D7X87_23810 [bacterium D16-54]RKJ09977.1 hypothetical protein D7X65_24260 [bacterium D16-56]